MRQLTPLEVLVKRVIDQGPSTAWTSKLVTAKIAHLYNQYEDSPKAPSAQRIRTILSILANLQLITSAHQQEGKLGYYTYERIIPSAIIEYRTKHRPYAFWFSIITLPALLGLIAGNM